MPQRSSGRVFLCALCLLLGLAGQLSAATLHQTGTIEALSAGDYAGQIAMPALASQGDFGLGTFDALNGEMVVLDGVVHQVTVDGVVHKAKPGQTAPFAQVARFVGAIDLGRVDGLDLSGLTAAFTTIPQKIVLMSKAWMVDDPMGQYINFKGFVNKDTHELENDVNPIRKYQDGKVTWDIKEIGRAHV